jgi:hypothetical protein
MRNCSIFLGLVSYDSFATAFPVVKSAVVSGALLPDLKLPGDPGGCLIPPGTLDFSVKLNS